MHEPIAYTYDADTHCPECTAKRFGKPFTSHTYVTEEDTYIGEIGEDIFVQAIFPWTEWHEPSEPLPQDLVCGTCLEVITSLTIPL